ncbi:hypothetical protein N1851_000072 [Merluccius polli]|uniref:HAT C-terminal dimerisation domain-containing protein n=1 Tax=Merluccius polli TaxID=89951 RepID=A0AA47NCQ0_MERPO|nr:hypothetical protein N1851_000072 [Merluccius polli]
MGPPSAEAERSFSALRRLKTWLQSTMVQIRLNNVAVCHIHKDLLDEVSKGTNCQEFILVNGYRKHVFGSFNSTYHHKDEELMCEFIVTDRSAVDRFYLSQLKC